MAERIRFYMDQHVPAAVTQGLRQRGVDIETAQDANQCGASDSQQLRFAAAEQRVIVTFDSDYLALHASNVEHAGIAWCPARKYTVAQFLHALLLVYSVLDADEMRNHVEYL